MRLTTRAAILFMLPAFVLYATFIVFPTLRGIGLSFTDAQGVVGGNFVGLDNYVRLFGDPAVLSALLNTLVFAVIVTVGQNVLALALAYWLQSLPRLQAIARAGILLPSMMAFIAVGFVWNFIYSPIDGPLDSVMNAVGLRGLEHIWLGDPTTALTAVAVTNIWMYMGYSATIYLAGYFAIPENIMEAAKIDGATGWARFRTVDWPLLAPALTINVTLTTIGSLRVFDPILVMTGGGPGNATQSLSYLVYTNTTQFQFGYATAIAVVLLVLTVIVAITQTTIFRRREIEW
ncbi:MAG TPA: sugar ABC transporter permease [Galbitalea sp.]|jgi:ABC-type sugar transport system permease subunit|nr:sugar ABC transporter permease [Galbitalea sp.]